MQGDVQVIQFFFVVVVASFSILCLFLQVSLIDVFYENIWRYTLHIYDDFFFSSMFGMYCPCSFPPEQKHFFCFLFPSIRSSWSQQCGCQALNTLLNIQPYIPRSPKLFLFPFSPHTSQQEVSSTPSRRAQRGRAVHSHICFFCSI